MKTKNIKYLYFCLWVFCLFRTTTELYAQPINIIPKPLKVKLREGVFRFTPNTCVLTDNRLRAEATLFTARLSQVMGYSLPLKQLTSVNKNQSNTIVFTSSHSSELGKEGYTLAISTQQVTVDASDPAGAFYATQSLLQLLPSSVFSSTPDKTVSWQIPNLVITDKPTLSWRACMLDEARHFKGKEVVYALLDQMALYKFNVFHWHLTDDQGWRMEIKKYPKLTTIGSKRANSQTGGWESKTMSGTPHEGFYTQQEIKEIIAYAAQRHIMIVPEIEMPGHASAAIAAYPWLGASNKPAEVSVWFGPPPHNNDALHIHKPEVVAFCKSVLDEVMNIFPSPFVHIGGDEVRYKLWTEDAEIVQYMKQHQISSPAELQIRFTNDLSQYIASKNKRMIGWNEILGGKIHSYNSSDQSEVTNTLSKSSIVQFWVGDLKIVKEALEKGYDVINSYHEYTYLDYGDEISLEKAYSFSPLPDGIDPSYQNKVLGAGCQMWSEWIPTVHAMNDRIYPKLFAYAESFWCSKETKNYADFKTRLPAHLKILDQLKINYHTYF